MPADGWDRRIKDSIPALSPRIRETRLRGTRLRGFLSDISDRRSLPDWSCVLPLTIAAEEAPDLASFDAAFAKARNSSSGVDFSLSFAVQGHRPGSKSHRNQVSDTRLCKMRFIMRAIAVLRIGYRRYPTAAIMRKDLRKPRARNPICKAVRGFVDVAPSALGAGRIFCIRWPRCGYLMRCDIRNDRILQRSR